MAHAFRTIVTKHADIRLTETDGTGLPIVMLHGSSASRRAFDPLLAGPIGAHHRTIALDLPGHGESGNAHDPAHDYSIPGLAECVADVLAQLRIDRFMLVGWSLGGHVAIELLHHCNAAGLMLVGTPPVPHGPIGMLRAFHTNWDMLLATKEHYSPRDIERYAHLCYGDNPAPELVDSIRRADGRFRPAVARSMMRGEGVDQKRTVEGANIPIAIVNGENDPFLRQSYFAGLNIANLWDDRVRVIYDAGHAAFRDNPERFTALIMRFAAYAETWQAPARKVALSA